MCAALRRGGVGPGITKRAKPGSLVGDRGKRVEKVAGRSRQTVEPGDQQHVTLVELRQGAAKPNAIGFGSAGSLPPNLGGTQAFTCASTIWPSVDTRA